jgi:hypothetical protein
MSDSFLAMLGEFPMSEILDSFHGVPFGNSDYQTDKFIVNSSLTPERAFRNLCLQMYYSQQKMEIDLEEIDWKLSSENALTTFDKRRLIVEKEQKLAQQSDIGKLIEDALHELSHMFEWWKKLPHPTREAFEKEEETYFRKSLRRQVLGVTGAAESLANMGLMVDRGELKKLQDGF